MAIDVGLARIGFVTNLTPGSGLGIISDDEYSGE